jgi:hypothetical protein
MENVHQSSGYRSVWRPLSRENDLSFIGSPSLEATVEKDAENEVTLTKRNETTELNAVLKKISEISDDIRSLDRRLQDQSEKLENLLNLLEDREGASKKYVFGLTRK